MASAVELHWQAGLVPQHLERLLLASVVGQRQVDQQQVVGCSARLAGAQCLAQEQVMERSAEQVVVVAAACSVPLVPADSAERAQAADSVERAVEECLARRVVGEEHLAHQLLEGSLVGAVVRPTLLVAQSSARRSSVEGLPPVQLLAGLTSARARSAVAAVGLVHQLLGLVHQRSLVSVVVQPARSARRRRRRGRHQQLEAVHLARQLARQRRRLRQRPEHQQPTALPVAQQPLSHPKLALQQRLGCGNASRLRVGSCLRAGRSTWTRQAATRTTTTPPRACRSGIGRQTWLRFALVHNYKGCK